MALHLEFRYRDDEPWVVVKQAFDIIAAYLLPDNALSAREAAGKLDSLTPSKRALNDGEEAEDSSSFLLEFWEVVIATARQVPHSHQAQERLVELMERLDGLSTPSSEVIWWSLLVTCHNIDRIYRVPAQCGQDWNIYRTY